MKAIFLGTGTSVGVPMIGCDCRVCRSRDPRNRRRRCSLYLEAGGFHLVVDTPPDFREQALQHRLPRVDAVVFTHSHADHVFGFDDVRRFNTIQRAAIPAYGSAATIRDLKRIFRYVVRGEKIPGTFRPQILFRTVRGPFCVGPFEVVPLDVEHGADPTFGYVFRAEGRSLGYIPDSHRVSRNVVAAARGVDVMVLNGLRHRPHPTHMTVADSVRILRAIGAKRSYLTHICHDLDHAKTERSLPATVRVAYDGLTLRW